MLITTDIYACGYNQNISLVINYDLPYNFDKYLHRASRSSIFGKSGKVLSLLNNNDRDFAKKNSYSVYNKIYLIWACENGDPPISLPTNIIRKIAQYFNTSIEFESMPKEWIGSVE